jgi:polyprenyl-phospho-N-acetylgalactosaminyl synthase
MKIYIVIAAYNESKRIGRVIDELLKEYKDIVVVDDGSSDSTSKIVKEKDVVLLRHVVNRGQGAALKTGIEYARLKGADIIVTYDADGQFLAKEIRDVIAPIAKGQYDIVLGSRFLGTAVNIPPMKRLVLKLGVIFVFLLYGIRITDSQSGFRALSKEAAEKINLSCDRMEHAGEFFYEIVRNKLKYKEVPITVIYDVYSVGKGQSWTRSVDLALRMIFRRFFL